MKRLAAVVLVIAALAGSVAVLSAGAAAKPKPTASADFATSVTVTGAHFKAKEKLTVLLIHDTTYKRLVTATAKGAFTADFGHLPLNSCYAYTLKVTGKLGSKFTYVHAVVPC
jgi:hypothetical protein